MTTGTRVLTFVAFLWSARAAVINMPCATTCPLSQLAAVLANTTDGDEVFLRGGVWTNCSAGPIPIPSISFTGSKSVTFQCNGEDLFLAVNGTETVTLRGIAFQATGIVLRFNESQMGANGVVQNCSFTQTNSTLLLGSNFNVADCIFENCTYLLPYNTSPAVGALTLATGMLTVDNCAFSNIRVYERGRVLWGMDLVALRNVVFENSSCGVECLLAFGQVFAANVTIASVCATGAVVAVGGELVLEKAVVTNTTVSGGAIIAPKTATIVDCLFHDNKAPILAGATPSIIAINSAFVGNIGRGNMIGLTLFRVINCVLMNNTYTGRIIANDGDTSIDGFLCAGNNATGLISSPILSVVNTIMVDNFASAELVGFNYALLDAVTFANNTCVLTLFGGSNAANISYSNFSDNVSVLGGLFSASAITCFRTRFMNTSMAESVLTGKSTWVEECDFVNNTGWSGPIRGTYGGTVVSATSLTARGCSFVSNQALGNYGGVILVSFQGFVFDSVFRQNSASYGGAIASTTSPTLVSNCSFEYNVASNDGGAIFIAVAGATSITGSQFLSNTAPQGGAISTCGITLISIATFTANLAMFGGAIWVNRTPRLMINESLLALNYASLHGGAFHTTNGIAIQNSMFMSNTAGLLGGGVHTDAGGSGVVDVESCRFSGNSATGGGAISIWAGVANLTSCSFEEDQRSLGGAAYTACGALSQLNSTFVDNFAATSSWASCALVDQTPVCASCQSPPHFAAMPSVSGCDFAPGLPWSMGDGAGGYHLVESGNDGASAFAGFCQEDCIPPTITDPHAIPCIPSLSSPCLLSCETGYNLGAGVTQSVGCGAVVNTTICEPGHRPKHTTLALVIGISLLFICLSTVVTLWAYKQRRACFNTGDVDAKDFEPLLPRTALLPGPATASVVHDSSPPGQPLLPSSALLSAPYSVTRIAPSTASINT